MPRRTCVLCGEEFETRSSRRLMCYKDHFHPCPICGKDVVTVDLYHQQTCCCSAHSRQLATTRIHDRFEEWPTNSKEAAAKRKKTCIEHFGVDNPSKNPEVRERISANSRAVFAERKSDIEAKQKATCLAKYGVEYASQDPAHKLKLRNRLIATYGTYNPFDLPGMKQRIDEINMSRYGTTVPMQNPDVWARQRSKKSSYIGIDGTPLDSTYEVDIYNYCVNNGIPIQRSYPIKYEYNGEEHTTFIDFVIDGVLVEAKGEHILDGYFDNQPGSTPIAVKLDIYRRNKVVVVTGSSHRHVFADSNGLKYLDKNPYPLIGVDIELFRNPEFPYSPSRPKCFYDVKVNKQRSAFEAFNDPLIRWKMIVNRINYVGGFIDSKSILTALNVTRTCKQPSWFAKSYAEYILKKYATSDTIVDPFAGWGARYDACKSLKKRYIGCDMNPELVEWHHSQGRESICEGDATTFTYMDECNVFICPPYQDVEVYFDGQNCKYTQCQWLEIVRKNVPNATRYIMVCKKVDPGYEKFVVEKKENKSHFGINYESVLVIDNDKTITNT